MLHGSMKMLLLLADASEDEQDGVCLVDKNMRRLCKK